MSAVLCVPSRCVLHSYSPSQLAANDCLLTVVITAFHTPIPMDTVKDIHPENCRVAYVYWVTEMSYDRAVLESDQTRHTPFIVRSNVEEDGYLSFILPLLYNSTYSLIIDAGDLYSLPSSDWIDGALSAIQTNPSLVPVCGLYPNSQVGRGCMLLRSIDLRYIWSMTTFRRKRVKAMEVFSHMVRCKFDLVVTDSILPSPCLVTTVYTPSAYVEENCEKVYEVEDFKCDAHYRNDHTTGVVISQYKRPYLTKQLQALQMSDANVTETIVVQGGHKISLESVLKAWPSVRHVWMTNWDSPFFFRFLLSFELSAYYIHHLNDDILVGKTTLTSLNRVASKYNAPVTTNGRLVTDLDYKTGAFKQKCLYPRKEYAGEADFVIGLFGGRMESMKVFWRYRPLTQRNGEDIHHSMSNNVECGVKSRLMAVNRESDKTKDLGNDGKGASLKSDHYRIRGQLLRSWVLQGAHLIQQFPSFPSEYEKHHYVSMRYFN